MFKIEQSLHLEPRRFISVLASGSEAKCTLLLTFANMILFSVSSTVLLFSGTSLNTRLDFFVPQNTLAVSKFEFRELCDNHDRLLFTQPSAFAVCATRVASGLDRKNEPLAQAMEQCR